MSVMSFQANTTTRAQLFAESVWRRKLPKLFWARFMEFPTPGQKMPKENYIINDSGSVVGYKSGQESLIYMVREFQKNLGDKITFPQIDPLTGEGILGSSGITLEGNEEAFSVNSFYLELESYAHAVADKSPLGRQRLQFSLLNEFGPAMMSWIMTRTEKNIWNALYAGTPTTILYPADVTAVAGLTNTQAHKMSMALLRAAKSIAKTDGSVNNGTSTTTPTRFIIEPIMIGGKEWFVVGMSEDAFLDLKEDAEYKTSLQNAMPKGEDNPIFAGADAIFVDGIVVYAHQRAVNLTTGGANGDVPYARVKLLGQRAICFAMGPTPTLVEQLSDYKRKVGLGGELMMKAQRPTVGSQDIGSLEIRVAITRKTF